MQELADSAERLLAERCTPQTVRAIEADTSPTALWEALQQSGFLDALVPEHKGGAGLNLRDVFPLLYMCGKYAVPVPLAQTMVARALLAGAEAAIPAGPITIADAMRAGADGVTCARVPYGRTAQWVLAGTDNAFTLLSIDDARVERTGVHGSLEADIAWRDAPTARRLEAPVALRAIGACLYAAQLAGAMAHVLDITLRYANDRVQFGRSIGKFQAIQHQLSIMAEQVCAARMAAQMACHSASHLPDARLAAVGKARTSEAAVLVASIGHAVHGAIGFTAEYDLQLYTRRLHEWRLAYGSEGYWHRVIGAELLAGDETALDFIRGRLFPRADSQ